MLIRFLCFLLLIFSVSYDIAAHTLVLLRDTTAIPYISLVKVAKYRSYPMQYGTVAVHAWKAIDNGNVGSLPQPLNKIIFDGHGEPGLFEGFDATQVQAEINRLINVLATGGKLPHGGGNLQIFSCSSSERPGVQPSITDAIIDGLVDANVPNLKVNIQGNNGTSIINVFTGAVNDIVRIVSHGNDVNVEPIQTNLEQVTLCNQLEAGCPQNIQNFFNNLPANDIDTFEHYTDYLQTNPANLTIWELADLAYYNQGVRNFYTQLIQQSDPPNNNYLLPQGQGLFQTTYNHALYINLPQNLTQANYLQSVKDGNPPQIQPQQIVIPQQNQNQQVQPNNPQPKKKKCCHCHLI
jgi:hypothetical protein